MIHFEKFHGAGNDFILIDNRQNNIQLSNKEVYELCHRRFGIGADGLIELLISNENDVEFKMRYYNSDGNEGSFCGNGGRTFVAFANFLGLCKQGLKFEATDGIHHAEIISSENNSWQISLHMKDVDQVKQLDDNEYFMNTGSPHLVIFVHKADLVDVEGMGKMIRHQKRFKPDGTNVNFASAANGKISVRTYERGVEAETFSCGTGVTAAAIAAADYYNLPETKIPIETKGGHFLVQFAKVNESYQNIVLTGPVVRVFSGDFL